jgi:hypothetical protein
MIVDRIEDGIAVLEGESGWLEVPVGWLPAGAREGSVLRVAVEADGDSSRVSLTLDAEAMAEREAEIRRLRESIPEGPGGDIAL